MWIRRPYNGIAPIYDKAIRTSWPSPETLAVDYYHFWPQDQGVTPLDDFSQG
jgi:hypothetical protein